MQTHAAWHPSARVLLAAAAGFAALAALLRRAAHRANAAIERRREARAALEQLRAMSERELRDIGLDASMLVAVAEGRLRRDASSRIAAGGIAGHWGTAAPWR